MARFAILRHEMPGPQRGGVHWDFMLEQDGVLRTWALAEEPAVGREIAAEALGNHRLAYLDYEGPVSDNRGSVSRWDFGQYECQTETADELIVRLQGTRLNGTARLQRQPADQQFWIFAYWV
jgi:hypothetical protein